MLYDFYSAIGLRFALDRFLINLNLGGASNVIPRQTYHGIYNIAQLDLSFNIRCSADYFGLQCSKFCSELVGVSTCDAMGNRICSNSSCDPSTDCLVCTTTTSLNTADITRPSSETLSGAIILFIIVNEYLDYQLYSDISILCYVCEIRFLFKWPSWWSDLYYSCCRTDPYSYSDPHPTHYSPLHHLQAKKTEVWNRSDRTFFV